jgi:hypothetical protein
MNEQNDHRKHAKDDHDNTERSATAQPELIDETLEGAAGGADTLLALARVSALKAQRSKSRL